MEFEATPLYLIISLHYALFTQWLPIGASQPLIGSLMLESAGRQSLVPIPLSPQAMLSMDSPSGYVVKGQTLGLCCQRTGEKVLVV